MVGSDEKALDFRRQTAGEAFDLGLLVLDQLPGCDGAFSNRAGVAFSDFRCGGYQDAVTLFGTAIKFYPISDDFLLRGLTYARWGVEDAARRGEFFTRALEDVARACEGRGEESLSQYRLLGLTCAEVGDRLGGEARRHFLRGLQEVEQCVPSCEVDQYWLALAEESVSHRDWQEKSLVVRAYGAALVLYEQLRDNTLEVRGAQRDYLEVAVLFSSLAIAQPFGGRNVDYRLRGKLKLLAVSSQGAEWLPSAVSDLGYALLAGGSALDHFWLGEARLVAGRLRNDPEMYRLAADNFLAALEREGSPRFHLALSSAFTGLACVSSEPWRKQVLLWGAQRSASAALESGHSAEAVRKQFETIKAVADSVRKF